MKQAPLLWFALFSVAALPSTEQAGGDTVTLESLLREMIDRDGVAKWPQPFYRCKQFSSYEPKSKTPEDAKGWFANADRGNFLRTERVGNRQEWVLMDHTGPGCITRYWAPDRRSRGQKEEAVVRFYLDGSDKPAIETPYLDLLSGKAWTSKPLAHVSRRAGVLFFPIAYAKSCKITLDRAPFYYIINYRAYEEGTKVETFSMGAVKAAGKSIESVGKALMEAKTDQGDTATLDKTLAAGAEEVVVLPAGPAAVRSLTVTLEPRTPQALRSTVLRMSFDETETVWCPLGDFFGSGVGYNPFHGWYRTIDKNGTMTCRWTMPYGKSARITIANLGKQPVKIKLAATAGPWKWDDRSMVFHATWRQQQDMPTRPMTDWNYVTIEGQGVYVGDTLAVMNPVAKWWGEGDEKIRVDGESFPSHFGTGTEDYYGYAWGGLLVENDFYTHPFHAQPQSGPNRTYGHNTETRTRVLDAIPFKRSLKLDMEVWHWADCRVAYAVASYWYALPGATSNRKPSPDEAARDVPAVPPLKAKPKQRPGKAAVKGAVELEKLKPQAKSEGVVLTTQSFSRYGWSGGSQYLVRTTKVGDFVEFRFPAKGAGQQKITLYGTKAKDYGQFRISVNGKAIERVFDFYNAEVVKTGAVALGTFGPKDGAFVLRFEVVGSNPSAVGAKTYAGLDCVTVTGAP